MDDSPQQYRGLRPVELILIVLTVLILAGLFVVYAERSRLGLGGRTRCQNNLKQIGLAISNYAGTFEGQLPPLYSAPNANGAANPQSFFFALLPFLEQDRMYQAGIGRGLGGQALVGAPVPGKPQVNLTWACQFDKGQIWSHGFVKAFVCDADPTNGISKTTDIGWVGSSYGANYQVFGTEDWKPKYNIDKIPDGLSNTVFVADRFAQFPGPDGVFVDPDGIKQQANNLWAWPANHSTVPPTRYIKPVPQNTAMFAYFNQKTKAGYGKEVFDTPQIVIQAQQADYRLPQSGHTAVVNVFMGDGSVRGVSAHIKQTNWQNALIPDDGNELGTDWSQ
jgi:hypothetical protein